MKVKKWTHGSLICAFYIPLLCSALDNMDTFHIQWILLEELILVKFFAFLHHIVAHELLSTKIPKRVCVQRQDMENFCLPARTVNLACVFT